MGLSSNYIFELMSSSHEHKVIVDIVFVFLMIKKTELIVQTLVPFKMICNKFKTSINQSTAKKIQFGIWKSCFSGDYRIFIFISQKDNCTLTPRNHLQKKKLRATKYMCTHYLMYIMYTQNNRIKSKTSCI